MSDITLEDLPADIRERINLDLDYFDVAFILLRKSKGGKVISIERVDPTKITQHYSYYEKEE